MLSNPIDLSRLCSSSWPLFVWKSICVTIQYQPGRENFHMPQFCPAHPQPGGMATVRWVLVNSGSSEHMLMPWNQGWNHILKIGHWKTFTNWTFWIMVVLRSILMPVYAGLELIKLAGEVLLFKLVNNPLGTATYQQPILGTSIPNMTVLLPYAF